MRVPSALRMCCDSCAMSWRWPWRSQDVRRWPPPATHSSGSHLPHEAPAAEGKSRQLSNTHINATHSRLYSNQKTTFGTVQEGNHHGHGSHNVGRQPRCRARCALVGVSLLNEEPVPDTHPDCLPATLTPMIASPLAPALTQPFMSSTSSTRISKRL